MIFHLKLWFLKRLESKVGDQIRENQLRESVGIPRFLQLERKDHAPIPTSPAFFLLFGQYELISKLIGSLSYYSLNLMLITVRSVASQSRDSDTFPYLITVWNVHSCAVIRRSLRVAAQVRIATDRYFFITLMHHFQLVLRLESIPAPSQCSK